MTGEDWQQTPQLSPELGGLSVFDAIAESTGRLISHAQMGSKFDSLRCRYDPTTDEAHWTSGLTDITLSRFPNEVRIMILEKDAAETTRGRSGKKTELELTRQGGQVTTTIITHLNSLTGAGEVSEEPHTTPFDSQNRDHKRIHGVLQQLEGTVVSRRSRVSRAKEWMSGLVGRAVALVPVGAGSK